jgi:phage FluMu protein Com
MDQPKVVCGLDFTVEVRCPHCQNLNRFQKLSAVHGNIKNNLLKKVDDFQVESKCSTCEKRFQIVKAILM